MEANRFFLALTAMMCTIVTVAKEVMVGNINYNVVPKAHAAEVIALSSGKYSGAIVIPPSIDVDGMDCIVTSIGDDAFYECSGLTSITIPNSVTSIGDYAFSSSGLTSVIIPNSVTSIGKRVFYACSDLTSVTIPNSITSIGDKAFQYCSNLTSITIPNSVTHIGAQAFGNCSGLTSFTISTSVTSIGNYVLYNCNGLTSIVVAQGNPRYDSRDNCNAIIETKTNALIVGCKNTAIPDGITSIGTMAFYGCCGLTSIIIPESMMEIGNQAFANCEQLEDVYSYAAKVPYTGSDTFKDSYVEYATLHVPDSAIEHYQETAPWSGFGTIVALDGEMKELPKCATPTLIYEQGRLTFNSETEGVSFVSDITDTDIKINYTAELNLSLTYTITVYATKKGYKNSDSAIVTLCWLDATPEVINGGESITVGMNEVKARPVLIQNQGSTLVLNGVEADTPISVYDLSGCLMGSGTATEGTTRINTKLTSGQVAIVKMGGRSVKVKIQ